MESGSDAEMNAKVQEIINILQLPCAECFEYYNKQFNEYTQNIEITARVQTEFNVKVQEITKSIQVTREKLEKSSFFEGFMRQMQSPDMVERIEKVIGTDPHHSQLQLVLYGIGRLSPMMNIQNVEPMQMQFAFALLLREKFPWVNNDIEVYDPMLSPLERRVIKEFNCTILFVNEGGRRTVDRPTLFFMPFCPFHLYENLLDANWTPHNFGKIIILGTNFDVYSGRGCKKVKAVRIRDHVRHEIPLPLLTPGPGAANVFSLEPGKVGWVYVVETDPVFYRAFYRAFYNLSWQFFAWDGSLDDLSLDISSDD